MGNPNLIPYETIVRATSGEPEAVNEVLRYYSHSRPCRYDTAGSHTAATFPRTDFSRTGNQITPTPGTERRCRHKPYPFGIRRTLLPCRQSGEGVHKSANL